MDKKEIEKKVKIILADRLDLELSDIKSNSSLRDDLGMDSFVTVELLHELREQFGVEIPPQEFINIVTVDDIINFITSVIKGK
jgi:acyl carrier protein